MATRDEFLALAARAEAGGDAGLSDDCWIALGWRRGCGSEVNLWLSPLGAWHYGPRPDLRVSLDAVEEVPGRIVKALWLSRSNRYGVETEELPDATQPVMPCFAPTECLARLAAKLHALAAAQKESGGG